MKYFKCDWIHNFADEPVTIFSELDNNRMEVRKIEIYKDGRVGYAFEGLEFGGSRLGKVPVPSFEEINADPEFRLIEISQKEFNAVWDEFVGNNL